MEKALSRTKTAAMAQETTALSVPRVLTLSTAIAEMIHSQAEQAMIRFSAAQAAIPTFSMQATALT